MSKKKTVTTPTKSRGPETPLQRLSRGPIVTLAVMCERAIIDRDETVSLIRIVDNFDIDGKAYVLLQPGEELSRAFLPIPISFQIVVMIKMLPRTGWDEIEMIPFGPDGNQLYPPQEHRFMVSGDLRSGGVRSVTSLEIGGSGTYTIAIMYRHREIGAIPFTVNDRRQRIQISDASEAGPDGPVYGVLTSDDAV